MTLPDSKAALDEDMTLEQAGVANNSTVYIKDLGRQASWRTVYLIEYVSMLPVIANRSEES